MGKGLTPIISVILLMLIVVAMAGSAFFFISRIQGQMQGGVESFGGQVFETVSSQVEIVSANYNRTGHNLTLFIKNVGNNKLPVDNGTNTPTTTWIFKDTEQNVICSSDFSGIGTQINCQEGCGIDLKIREIRKITTNNLSLTTCSDITDDDLYGLESRLFFTIDFSGVSTASGSFIK